MKNAILGLAFVAALMTSCKNNEAAATEETAVDTAAVAVDSAATAVDTAATAVDTAAAAAPATEEVKK